MWRPAQRQDGSPTACLYLNHPRINEVLVAAFDGWSKMDGALFNAYKERFGMVCSFSRPDLTSEQFNELFRTALETGVEIDYVKAGWDDPDSLEKDALI